MRSSQFFERSSIRKEKVIPSKSILIEDRILPRGKKDRNNNNTTGDLEMIEVLE